MRHVPESGPACTGVIHTASAKRLTIGSAVEHLFTANIPSSLGTHHNVKRAYSFRRHRSNPVRTIDNQDSPDLNLLLAEKSDDQSCDADDHAQEQKKRFRLAQTRLTRRRPVHGQSHDNKDGTENDQQLPSQRHIPLMVLYDRAPGDRHHHRLLTDDPNDHSRIVASSDASSRKRGLASGNAHALNEWPSALDLLGWRRKQRGVRP